MLGIYGGEAPVPVREIASAYGIAVVDVPAAEGASGALLWRDGRYYIVVRDQDSNNRRNFTIAHELGHYVMHAHQPGLEFVDEFNRNHVSSRGTDPNEVEANAFAAALLMPARLVKTAYDQYLREHFYADEAPSVLAKQFEVSSSAMGYRLQRLGLAGPY